MVRILIADDHEVVRRGARALLETRPDFAVIAEAADGREAYQKILELRPDVAIIDISMPDMNGIEAIRRIKRCGFLTEVLALVARFSETLAREVLEAGASGYVLKSGPARDLISAVDSVARHTTFLGGELSHNVFDKLRGCLTAPIDRNKLSSREIQTLRLLSEGKTNKDIARLLFLSVRTVETHRANVMAKLNLHSVCELVHYAIRHNIASI